MIHQKKITFNIIAPICTGFIVFLFFVGCVRDPLTVNNNSPDDSGAYVGSITGRVLSASNGTALDSVKVILTGDHEGGNGASKSVYTDDHGYYQFNNLRIGNYQITIEPTDSFSGVHTSVIVATQPGHPAIGGNTNIEINVSKDIDLLPFSSELNGIVYTKKDKLLSKVALNGSIAAGAIIQIYIPNQIPDRFTDTTDAYGRFSFTGLPATAFRNIDAQIVCLPFIDNDGTMFDQVKTTVQLVVGKNTLPAFTMASYAEPFFVFQSTLDGIPVYSFNTSGAIKLITSADVDSSRLTGISIFSSSGDASIALTTNKDTVTIKPVLPLRPSTSYTLNYTLYSTDGRSTGFQSIVFTTVQGIQLLSTSFMDADGIKNAINVSDSIVLAFSINPVLDASTKISLKEGSLPIAISTEVQGTKLIIKSSNNLRFGVAYTLSINHLKSSILADDYTNSIVINTKSSPAPTGAITGIALEDSLFKADYDTTRVSVKWNKSSDAATYNIYVKNTKHPSWILLAANKDKGDNFSTIQHAVVSFNDANFDMINNGSSIEPFGLGALCSLMVVPTSVDGIEGGMSTRAYSGFKDLIQPTIFKNATFTQLTDANINNISGAPVKINFTVEFTEYMNTSQDANLSVIGNGFSTVAFSNWTWSSTEGSLGKNKATFSITIPDNINLDNQQISISTISDLSGNLISNSVVIRLTDN